MRRTTCFSEHKHLINQAGARYPMRNRQGLARVVCKRETLREQQALGSELWLRVLGAHRRVGSSGEQSGQIPGEGT